WLADDDDERVGPVRVVGVLDVVDRVVEEVERTAVELRMVVEVVGFEVAVWDVEEDEWTLVELCTLEEAVGLDVTVECTVEEDECAVE
ncbi:hypothetical protein HK101_006956, partial [Irineochytrium annulatum]